MARPDPTLSSTAPGLAGYPAGFGESGPVPLAVDEQRQRHPLRWIHWHRRALTLLALLGCVGLFALVRGLIDTPQLPATWRDAAQGGIELAAATAPALQPHLGQRLLRVTAADGSGPAVQVQDLHRSPRWVIDDASRARSVRAHEQLATLLARPEVALHFEGSGTALAQPQPRGLAGLGLLFWLTSALALLLYLVGAVAMLAHMKPRNVLYLVMTLCQAGNLLFIAVQSMPGLGAVAGSAVHEVALRSAFDLVTAAAVVHACTLPPLRVQHRLLFISAAWLFTAVLSAVIAADRLPFAWAWTQAACLVMGSTAVGLLFASYRTEPNPFAVLMRRFAVVTVGTLALLMLAVMAADRAGNLQQSVAQVGSYIWYVFFASMLLLLPFMSRSQQALREFALLAGVSTVATSLDLLFVSAFSISHFASLSLAVFLALGTYAGARQWLLNQMLGSQRLTAERMFERLYRIVREVEVDASQSRGLLTELLRDLFDPLELRNLERQISHARVVGDGSAMLVPFARMGDDAASANAGSLLLRFAGRGKRMFTREDARLSDQVVEQLMRAVAYDKAVERGRTEERLRIAQDLHDDIGARLLTLMYKAQTPEMEDYLRHTLQDLKTLTRGLAASDHQLSHAVAEWKADITQRLSAAHIELDWHFTFDDDYMLSMVQWSAITRVLRELVSNIIYHASATRLEISATLENGRFTLLLADDGVGRNPQAWAHGLGMGGVRKRVKLLRGDVKWRENRPQGIVCEVRVANLDARA